MDHLLPDRTHLKLTFKSCMLLQYYQKLRLCATGIAHIYSKAYMALVQNVPWLAQVMWKPLDFPLTIEWKNDLTAVRRSAGVSRIKGVLQSKCSWGNWIAQSRVKWKCDLVLSTPPKNCVRKPVVYNEFHDELMLAGKYKKRVKFACFNLGPGF